MSGESVPRAGKRPRLLVLDILRGIAILLVLGSHPVLLPESAGRLAPLAALWFRFGWTGVDLFFVLSGFLVGGLLFQEIRARQRLDVRRFIIRRGFKIWPAFFVYLACFFLRMVLEFHLPVGQAVALILPNCLHLQNYLWNPTGHTWSLAVEEHFYLGLPLLLLGILRFRRRPLSASTLLPLCAIGVMVLCAALRCLVNWDRPFRFETHFYPTHLRMDSLFFGVLLAYSYHFHPRHFYRLYRYRFPLLLLGLALLAPMMFLSRETDPFVCTLGFTLLSLGYGCLLIVALSLTPLHGRSGRLLHSLPLRGIAATGYFSYSIYLWHMDIGRRLPDALQRRYPLPMLAPEARWLLWMALYMGFAIVSGAMLSRLIERPALALRERLFPARATEPVADIAVDQAVVFTPFASSGRR